MYENVDSAFYPIVHKSFSNSYGFTLLQEFNPFYPHLVLYSQNLLQNNCASLSLLIKLQAKVGRDSGTGASCEFWEISNSNFSYRTPLVAASSFSE